MSERYLRSIRLLAECMQAFEKQSSRYTRQFDLTQAQFDIIATLGNTTGMTCRELGDKTLITKGTLTGVLDRLELKGLVTRERGVDRRQLWVKLTPTGEATFEQVLPQVVEMGKQPFAAYSDTEFELIEEQLKKLKSTLESK
jgi:MarR family transcriptional regulator, 2-MHQ and catechol-resistance regulon repressor